MLEELMLIENPYGRYNPRRRHAKGGKKMAKNPTAMITREWLQGVDATDATAALGGLAAATMLPGIFVKDTATTTGKLLKLLASVGSTIAAGFIFRNISSTAGKMAIAGGLAGTLSQALAMFTNVKIGAPRRYNGRIGESRTSNPGVEETVQGSVT